jgi:hypothetical protein
LKVTMQPLVTHGRAGVADRQAQVWISANSATGTNGVTDHGEQRAHLQATEANNPKPQKKHKKRPQKKHRRNTEETQGVVSLLTDSGPSQR